MRIEWSPRARKNARKLQKGDRDRIVKALERFAETGHGDVKTLTDVDPREYRLRVGDHRAFFARQGAVLLVLRIRHRRDAY